MRTGALPFPSPSDMVGRVSYAQRTENYAETSKTKRASPCHSLSNGCGTYFIQALGRRKQGPKEAEIYCQPHWSFPRVTGVISVQSWSLRIFNCITTYLRLTKMRQADTQIASPLSLSTLSLSICFDHDTSQLSQALLFCVQRGSSKKNCAKEGCNFRFQV